MIATIKIFTFGVVLFIVIFTTKLHGKVDVPIIIGFIFFLLALIKHRIAYPAMLVPYVVYLFMISIYAIFISLVYGANEIIFAMKFMHTLLLFLLLYFVWLEVKDYISYDKFTKYFVLMVAVHSIIILCAIVFPDFRHALYGVTGYVPRGPEWSRSPGLTVSFNATAIVHVTGLWFLLSRKDWTGWKRWCLTLLILSPFIFLGRFISFVGIFLVMCFLLMQLSFWKKILAGAIVVASLPLLGWLSQLEYDVNTVDGQVLANYHHFVDPLMLLGRENGADSYYSNTMSKHVYFSDQWYVLLFGNSYAGHIGLLTGAYGDGETDSDIGVINSINANGIVITASIFIFYFLLIWTVRNKDWQPIAIVSLLSLSLSFKETGFFTSHATPLLFLLFFYQLLSEPCVNDKRRIV